MTNKIHIEHKLRGLESDVIFFTKKYRKDPTPTNLYYLSKVTRSRDQLRGRLEKIKEREA